MSREPPPGTPAHGRDFAPLLEEGARPAGLAVLRRLLAYARKVLQWEDPLDAIGDARCRPQIRTSVVLRSVGVLFLARLGSLNALEQTHASRSWHRWLSGALPSADTVGRVCAQVEPSDVRALHHHVYARLKRTKALEPPAHGVMAAAIDGHESHATYRRGCPGCPKRTIHTTQGYRTQYYHRHVALQLIGRDFRILLDAEPQRPGEDEVAAALRLPDRVLDTYPRAFDVVIALGHSRRDVENQGFNEMATRWHADHVYKHDPTALLVFWRLAMICLTVFVVFYTRNLKPQARRNASLLHIARLISADLYRAIPAGPPQTPM